MTAELQTVPLFVPWKFSDIAKKPLMGIDDGESARTPTSPIPERSSAAATQNETVASWVLVSKRTGLMEKLSNTGGVTSWL
jgi:hypothetical protein